MVETIQQSTTHSRNGAKIRRTGIFSIAGGVRRKQSFPNPLTNDRNCVGRSRSRFSIDAGTKLPFPAGSLNVGPRQERTAAAVIGTTILINNPAV
jgi:hypothetical protein